MNSTNARPLMRLSRAAAAASATLLSVPAFAALPVFYGPSQSGDPNGLAGISQLQNGMAVNNAGVAVGYAAKLTNNVQTVGYGYRWRAVPNEAPLQLTPLATGTNQFSTAVAINDAGVIVGTSYKSNGQRRGVLYATPGSAAGVELKTNGNTAYDYSTAIAINKSGLVVGESNTQSNASTSVAGVITRWAPGSTTASLTNPISSNPTTGVNTSSPIAVNDAGVIIGSFTRYSASGTNLGQRAMRTGLLLDSELQPLSMQPDGFGVAVTSAINNSGDVVGISEDFSGFALTGQLAVRWNAGSSTPSRLQNLGTGDINGLQVSAAYDINDSGTAVGLSIAFNPDGTTYRGIATRWAAGGTAGTALNDLGGSATGHSAVAQYINNSGSVAGYAVKDINDSSVHVVVWPMNSTQPIDLATLVQNAVGTTFVPTSVNTLTDTGFVTGIGTYTTASNATYQRLYTMMVPQAGTYGQGDANLDTVVNFDDLIILAQHYGENNPAQAVTVGDLNLDGKVNFDDLIALAQHYSSATAAGTIFGAADGFAADWALAQSLVPEPTSLAAIGLLAGLTRRSRRDAFATTASPLSGLPPTTRATRLRDRS